MANSRTKGCPAKARQDNNRSPVSLDDPFERYGLRLRNQCAWAGTNQPGLIGSLRGETPPLESGLDEQRGVNGGRANRATTPEGFARAVRRSGLGWLKWLQARDMLKL